MSTAAAHANSRIDLWNRLGDNKFNGTPFSPPAGTRAVLWSRTSSGRVTDAGLRVWCAGKATAQSRGADTYSPPLAFDRARTGSWGEAGIHSVSSVAKKQPKLCRDTSCNGRSWRSYVRSNNDRPYLNVWKDGR
jgi:hypothetical protein